MQQQRSVMIAQAKALLEASAFDQAATLYKDLADQEPGHPAGLLGLARVAAARGAWGEAAGLWDSLIAGFPDRAMRPWRLAHARALIYQGRADLARTELATLLEEVPGDPVALFLFSKLLQAGSRPAARAEIEDGFLRQAPVFAVALARLRTLIWLHDMPAARDSFQESVLLADQAGQLEMVFEHIAQLFDGWRRIAAWQHIERSLDDLTKAGVDEEEAGARTALRLRVRVSLRDHDGFMRGLEKASGQVLPQPFAGKAAQLALVLGRQPFPDFMAPKIFGIGLTRTGTTSLTTALEMLGYTTAHFRNDFSEALIADEDFFLFDALLDTPVAAQFERLYFMFPNARFIYTRRNRNDWATSFGSFLEKTQGTADFAELRQRLAEGRVSHCGTDFAALMSSLYANHADARAAYESCESRVDGFFSDKPEEKLLVHDVFAGDGWPELCGFLGHPVPDVAYPWENRARPGEAA